MLTTSTIMSIKDAGIEGLERAAQSMVQGSLSEITRQCGDLCSANSRASLVFRNNVALCSRCSSALGENSCGRERVFVMQAAQH
jgi:hypothetical protein